MDSADSSRYATYNFNLTMPYADWDWDGDVDLSDNSAYTADYNADSGLGRGDPSYAYGTAGGANRRAYAGYEIDPVLTGSAGWESVYHVRHRVLLSQLGRWTRRDPLEYAAGNQLYSYASQPIQLVDGTGLVPCPPERDCTIEADECDCDGRLEGICIVSGEEVCARLCKCCDLFPDECTRINDYLKDTCTDFEHQMKCIRVSCEDIPDDDQGSISGRYSCLYRKITIKKSNCETDDNPPCQTLFHELIHAGDHCSHGRCSGDHDEDWVCTEARAAHEDCCRRARAMPTFDYNLCIENRHNIYKETYKGNKDTFDGNWYYCLAKAQGAKDENGQVDCSGSNPIEPYPPKLPFPG